jgi:hypothetical protein
VDERCFDIKGSQVGGKKGQEMKKLHLINNFDETRNRTHHFTIRAHPVILPSQNGFWIASCSDSICMYPTLQEFINRHHRVLRFVSNSEDSRLALFRFIVSNLRLSRHREGRQNVVQVFLET